MIGVVRGGVIGPSEVTAGIGVGVASDTAGPLPVPPPGKLAQPVKASDRNSGQIARQTRPRLTWFDVFALMPKSLHDSRFPAIASSGEAAPVGAAIAVNVLNFRGPPGSFCACIATSLARLPLRL